MINRRSRGQSSRRGDDNRRPQAAAISDLPEPGKIRLYGDRHEDGAIQISFTLPIGPSDKARVAAMMFAEKMGLKQPSVIHMEAMDRGFTFFVVYAVCEIEIDYAALEVPKLDYPDMDFDQVNELIKNRIGRKIVVIGACIGADAHTVGIDAIFNMKGYLGSYGLERYPQMKALNLRAQVDTEDLARKVAELQADAVLISRVVTQRDEHITELKKFLEALSRTPGVPPHLIKICGGPRLNHQIAKDIGYDAGFGPGTKPVYVASYIATEIVKRIGGEAAAPGVIHEN